MFLSSYNVIFTTMNNCAANKVVSVDEFEWTF